MNSRTNIMMHPNFMRGHPFESEPPLTMLHFCDHTGTAPSKENHEHL